MNCLTEQTLFTNHNRKVWEGPIAYYNNIDGKVKKGFAGPTIVINDKPIGLVTINIGATRTHNATIHSPVLLLTD